MTPLRENLLELLLSQTHLSKAKNVATQIAETVASGDVATGFSNIALCNICPATFVAMVCSTRQ